MRCSGCSRRQLSVTPVINSQGIVVEISDDVQEHLKRRLKYSTPEVVQATAELKRALTGRGSRRLSEDLFRRLGAPDAREVRPREYVELLEVLMDIFLPCRMKVKFEFIPAHEDGAYADCEIMQEKWGAWYARIRLHPTLHLTTRSPPARYQGLLNTASMDSMAGLLHEICHAILGLYACRKCEGDGPGGVNLVTMDLRGSGSPAGSSLLRCIVSGYRWTCIACRALSCFGISYWSCQLWRRWNTGSCAIDGG